MIKRMTFGISDTEIKLGSSRKWSYN